METLELFTLDWPEASDCCGLERETMKALQELTVHNHMIGPMKGNTIRTSSHVNCIACVSLLLLGNEKKVNSNMSCLYVQQSTLKMEWNITCVRRNHMKSVYKVCAARWWMRCGFSHPCTPTDRPRERERENENNALHIMNVYIKKKSLNVDSGWEAYMHNAHAYPRHLWRRKMHAPQIPIKMNLRSRTHKVKCMHRPTRPVYNYYYNIFKRKNRNCTRCPRIYLCTALLLLPLAPLSLSLSLRCECGISISLAHFILLFSLFFSLRMLFFHFRSRCSCWNNKRVSQARRRGQSEREKKERDELDIEALYVVWEVKLVSYHRLRYSTWATVPNRMGVAWRRARERDRERENIIWRTYTRKRNV